MDLSCDQEVQHWQMEVSTAVVSGVGQMGCKSLVFHHLSVDHSLVALRLMTSEMACSLGCLVLVYFLAQLVLEARNNSYFDKDTVVLVDWKLSFQVSEEPRRVASFAVAVARSLLNGLEELVEWVLTHLHHELREMVQCLEDHPFGIACQSVVYSLALEEGNPMGTLVTDTPADWLVLIQEMKAQHFGMVAAQDSDLVDMVDGGCEKLQDMFDLNPDKIGQSMEELGFPEKRASETDQADQELILHLEWVCQD